jgi:hypothetical protein
MASDASSGAHTQAELLQRLYGLNATITKQWGKLAAFQAEKDAPSGPLQRRGARGLTFTHLALLTPTELSFAPYLPQNSSLYGNVPPKAHHVALLTMTVTREVISIDDFSPFFMQVTNFFNDRTPQASWFDLAASLAKYEELRDSAKTCAMLASWKKGWSSELNLS